ncbi:hypothetical protein DLE60_13115 [Micromonospora globispora]|uniref:hypothetical protein n=1 Tax=Micromonospora globispora TaxID=1450148 RepID=UPI000D6ED9B3|nr:hypothetical protein [Micromonospora globispora]PWU60068.1 hypothetical protein DLE60_13115 [Micromonospora globispora]
MAEVSTLFLRSGEPVAQRLLDELVAELRVRYPVVAATPVGDGVGWASCELSSDRDVAGEARARYPTAVAVDEQTTPVALRVVTRPDTVKDAVNHGLAQGGPVDLTLCDTLAEITTSGYLLDWAIVRTIHRLTSDRWAAILYTAQAGFNTTTPESEA